MLREILKEGRSKSTFDTLVGYRRLIGGLEDLQNTPSKDKRV
jgi:hypothetical protein